MTDAAAMEEFLDGAMGFAAGGRDDDGSMWVVPEANGLTSVIERVTDRTSPRGT